MLAVLSRGAGVVAIAGALIFAPLAGQAAADSALIREAELILTIAAGGGAGIAAAAPEVAVAAGSVCATGVGCAVLAVGAAAAVGLYLTRDSWMPYVNNAWNEVSGANDGKVWGAKWSQQIVPGSVSANGLQMRYRYEPTSGVDNGAPFRLNTGGPYDCLRPSDGRMRRVNNFGISSGGPTLGAGQLSEVVVDVVVPGVYCDANEVLGGFSLIATIDTLVPSFTAQPIPEFTWGTMAVGAPTLSQTVHIAVNCRDSSGPFQVTGPDSITGPGVPIPALGQGVVQPTCATPDRPQAVGECTTLLGQLGDGPFETLSSTCAAAAAAASKYPNCVGTGAASCTYVVRYKGVPCNVGVLGCADWTVRAETAPADYACFYGPYPVALSACGLLERGYEPRIGTVTLNGPNTDGNPRTFTGPTPLSQPAPNSTPTPLSSTPPAPLGEPVPQPLPDPGGEDCYPTGWSMIFSPVDWVIKPVKCALAWAFVPDTATMTRLSDGAASDLTRVGIAPLAVAVGGIFPNIPTGGGCEGPAVTFEAVGVVKPMHPFSACEAPMSTLASISYAVSTVGIIGIGGFAALRAVGSGFGFQVGMGRGKSVDT